MWVAAFSIYYTFPFVTTQISNPWPDPKSWVIPAITAYVRSAIPYYFVIPSLYLLYIIDKAYKEPDPKDPKGW